jgi:hypothetical protein
MGKLITVRIAHRLGAAEARRRIETGFDAARRQFASQLSQSDVAWADQHADVVLGFKGQTLRAGLDVADDHVLVNVDLPWLLAPLATAAEKFLARRGEDILRIGKT